MPDGVDAIETFHGARIQHGPANQRVYLMKLDHADPAELAPALVDLAAKHGYGKVFAKVPAPMERAFLREGYEREGSIPRFYGGRTDAAFLAKFLHDERRRATDASRADAIVTMSMQARQATAPAPPDGYALREAGPEDAAGLAGLYADVFASYPFPIHDPAYIRETMESHVRYFVANARGNIAAAAAAEMDREARHVEMTDFAALPDHRGHRLATRLLQHMEAEMQEEGMRTLYTIARALSAGMNITFARCGYRYGGTLVNNTQISGSIESMNLWYRNRP